MSKKFYYRRGEIETTEPWLVPTIENFDAWLTEWKSSVDLTGFSVYLGGSFARPYWQSKNEDASVEDADLFVKEIRVDGGSMLKRLRPAPQGRAHRIRKRSNHVTVVLGAKNNTQSN